MSFLEYCKFRESTGTVGAASAGQGSDYPVNGEEFYRKFGNRVRPKYVAWDGMMTQEFRKKKKSPEKLYGRKKKINPVNCNLP